jgi:hypothetical protein
MASQQLNIRISEEENLHLEALASQTEGILTKQGVARLLIKHAIATGWQPLTSDPMPQIMAEPAARRASNSSSSSKTSLKPKSIHPSLLKHQELIEEFWRVKRGSKSEQGWKLLMTELEKLQKLYGDAVVEEQLRLASNGLWKGISVRLYEQFKAPKGATPAQAEHKHPAARVFSGGRFVDEDGPTTNPVLQGVL